MTDEEAIQLVRDELVRARKKFPKHPRDFIHAAGIICEEAGETMQAALERHYEGEPAEAISFEAIQTAAVSIRLLTGR